MNFSLNAVVGVLLAACAGPSLAGGLSLTDAVELAMRNAPGLVADAEQIEAASLAAMSAGALPDPKLLMGLENVPVDGPDAYRLSRDFMTMQRVGIMQDFPNRAKREARVAGAQSQISVALAQSRLTRLNAAQQAAQAWIARETAEKQLALVDELIAENDLFSAAVRARLLAGQGMATDAIAARQEAAAIEARRDELQAHREQAIAMLEQWIGAEAAQSVLAGEPPNWSINGSALLQGLQHHPEFALFDAQQRALDAKIAEAVAAKHPDWSMELAYQRRGPRFSNMVSLQLSVDLPVFSGSRQDPQIAARRAQRRALDSEREAGLREHAQMLQTQLSEYRRLSNAVERQRQQLLPLMQEKVELALADWRGGKGSLMDVAVARSQRIDARLRLIELEGDQRQLAATLHYVYADHTGEQP